MASDGGFLKKPRNLSSGRKSMHRIGGFVGGFFGVMLVVLLSRWFVSSTLGLTFDPLFKPYSDGSGLYYFDLFGYFKMVAESFGEWSTAFSSFVSSFNILSEEKGVLTGFFNSFVIVLNIVLFLAKALFFIPLQILFTIFGFVLPGWVGDDGWITQFINFWLPYIDDDAISTAIGYATKWGFSL